MASLFVRFIWVSALLPVSLLGEAYKTESGILYRGGSAITEYMEGQCRLDVYYPEGVDDFATVIWFHGGGLKNGKRYIPDGLRERGVAVASVSYRLHPKVKAPAYLEDAAASVAWVFKNIGSYGGSAKRVFVSGHSAGGYLAMMVGLDKRWLAAYGIDADHIAGLIPFSGQAMTHSTIRAEQGIVGNRAAVDDFAPLYHVRSDAAPILLITGDREMEMDGRYEENALFWRLLKDAGHSGAMLRELDGFGHSSMVAPAVLLIPGFVERVIGE